MQGTCIPLPSPQFIGLSLIVTVQEFVLQAFKKKNMVLANFPLSPFGKCPTIFLEDHCLYAKLNHDDAAELKKHVRKITRLLNNEDEGMKQTSITSFFKS